jgi:hypothetical protein
MKSLLKFSWKAPVILCLFPPRYDVGQGRKSHVLTVADHIFSKIFGEGGAGFEYTTIDNGKKTVTPCQFSMSDSLK